MESRKGQFKSSTVVVEFIRVFIIHTVTNLSFRCICFGRQIENLLRSTCQVWSDNHASRVTSPIFNIQTSIIFGQKGSPPFPKILSTKSRFATHPPKSKEPDFHGFLPNVTFHCWTNDRAKHQGYPALRWIFFSGRKREDHIILRRIQGDTKKLLGRV